MRTGGPGTSSRSSAGLSRRGFLAAAGGLLAAGFSDLEPGAARARDAETVEYRLRAAPARVNLAGEGYPDTPVWCYGGTVPGPQIRLAQGARLRVAVDNGLDQPTTVHWHGLRVPNAMDGVPELTQTPIAPGGRFVYEFDCPDAGTYWYHPHMLSSEQVGRGLYGPLIVEEADPPAVDRDLLWVLDDWRLGRDARIAGGFGNLRDMSHDGRIGNTVTVNGRVPGIFAARQGERIRLRLINAANARIFALDFDGHFPTVIALDGQPVAPHAPDGGRIVLGPAMRADIVLDMGHGPGARFAVADTFYKRNAYRLLDIVYSQAPLRRYPPEGPPAALAANTMPEPDIAAAERHVIAFGGGMMGALAGGRMGETWLDMREMMHRGKAWTINGVAAAGHVMAPLLSLGRGRSYVLAMDNRTVWHHPIHLHGHAFRVIARNGRPTAHREWRDTVLMAPRETVDIALVADNPGDWMFHCHILEHMAGGMMGVIRVA